MHNIKFLKNMGWQPFFQQQLNLSEYESTYPARVISHDRNHYILTDGNSRLSLRITEALPSMTVGDWVLMNKDDSFYKLLERKSLFSRKAAGTKIQKQLIASNVETLFIVTSMNEDFNLSRIERFLVLANEAKVEPYLILTKADLCDDNETFIALINKHAPSLRVKAVNALDPISCNFLIKECSDGSTIVLLGSSGVGKSTIINTLLSNKVQATQGIRENDSKGRHTTTSRSVHFLPNGGVIIDTPGMRELQLADSSDGLESTFSDIGSLAKRCKFKNCQHDKEVGCAVMDAINQGKLDLRRLKNYQKLVSETARNSMALHEIKSKEKKFSKMVNSVTRKPNYK